MFSNWRRSGGSSDKLRTRISNAGMVGVIVSWANPAIRSANSFGGKEWGPGWWVRGTCVLTGSGNDPVIIAGYK